MKVSRFYFYGFLHLCSFALHVLFSCSSRNKGEWNTFNEKNRGVTREVGLSDFQVPNKPVTFQKTGLNFANGIMDMEIVDSVLVLSNRVDSMNLTLVHVNDLMVSQNLIKRGKGENECLNVSDIVLGLREGHFFAFDVTLRKILKFDVEKIDRGNYALTETIVFKNEDIKGIKSPVQLSDETFAATNYFNSNCRYIKFSVADSLMQEVGELPPMSKNWPKQSDWDNIRSLSYSANLKRRTGHEDLAVAYTTTPRLEVYSKDMIRGVVVGPGSFEPVYKFKNGDPQITENTTFSHVKIKADADYIYSLYSGLANFASCANRILVFSWEDASPKTRIDLGLTVCKFAIKQTSPNRFLLFVIHADTGDLLKSEIQI